MRCADECACEHASASAAGHLSRILKNRTLISYEKHLKENTLITIRVLGHRNHQNDPASVFRITH